MLTTIHRPPPGDQSQLARYSISFFTRPAYHVTLRALKEKSPLIAQAVIDNPGDYDPQCTAGEWLARRIKKLRIKNRTVSLCDGDLQSYGLTTYVQGPETWYDSMGTEHKGIRDVVRPLPTTKATA